MIRIGTIGLLILLTACAAGPDRGPFAGQRYATVLTEGGNRAKGIYPVQIYLLDGKKYVSEQNVHRLKPGTHTLRARAFADWGMDRVSRPTSKRKPSPELRHNFQSGRRYYLGMKAPRSGSDDWELVIYRVEDVDEGTVDIDG